MENALSKSEIQALTAARSISVRLGIFSSFAIMAPLEDPKRMFESTPYPLMAGQAPA
jgi:hypothetical protein